jgi:hypothetical protein
MDRPARGEGKKEKYLCERAGLPVYARFIGEDSPLGRKRVAFATRQLPRCGVETVGAVHCS